MSETADPKVFFLPLPNNAAVDPYAAAVAAQEELKKEMLEWFKSLSIHQKAYLCRGEQPAYLDHDDWYCGHVHTFDGQGVSLYDDLNWERHETKSVCEVLYSAFDDWCEGREEPRLEYDPLFPEKYREARKNLYTLFCADIEEAPGAAAAVARDMLENCLGEATFDW